MKNRDKKRDKVHIPKGTKAHKFLFENNNGSPYPKWILIEQLLERQPKNKEDWVELAFKDFVQRVSLAAPEDKERFEALWGLVMKILWKQPLTETNIENLKKLCSAEPETKPKK